MSNRSDTMYELEPNFKPLRRDNLRPLEGTPRRLCDLRGEGVQRVTVVFSDTSTSPMSKFSKHNVFILPFLNSWLTYTLYNFVFVTCYWVQRPGSPDLTSRQVLHSQCTPLCWNPIFYVVKICLTQVHYRSSINLYTHTSYPLFRLYSPCDFENSESKK